MEFFAGAFLQTDGVAEVYNHFCSVNAFGVDDPGFPDKADSITTVKLQPATMKPPHTTAGRRY